jgi:S1-C subfamily serine protease
LIQFIAAISPGSSGGGLFDAHGNLVAITSYSLKGAQGINFAIPAEDFWR